MPSPHFFCQCLAAHPLHVISYFSGSLSDAWCAVRWHLWVISLLWGSGEAPVLIEASFNTCLSLKGLLLSLKWKFRLDLFTSGEINHDLLKLLSGCCNYFTQWQCSHNPFLPLVCFSFIAFCTDSLFPLLLISMCRALQRKVFLFFLSHCRLV